MMEKLRCGAEVWDPWAEASVVLISLHPVMQCGFFFFFFLFR